jgi:ATPase subunit of ABC transporter with duplicated ATPase domains
MSSSPTTDVVLSAQRVRKSFGAQPVLDDISLSIHDGERVGLIGRNGSGKSTLMKMLCGIEEPDDGLITRKQGIRVGYLHQECPLDPSITVGQALDDACSDLHALLARHDQLVAMMASGESGDADALQHEYEALCHELEVKGAWDLQQDVNKVSRELALPDASRTISTLSGGELRRVDLAATLLSKPDVLLLDEPTNHIDTPSAEWIEKYLASYPGSCVLITHDRYFLEMVVNRIVEIEFNRLYSFPGNYHRFLEYKSQLQESEAKSEDSRQNVLRRELDWLRRGPKARSTKQKARIKRYDDLEAQGGPRSHKETSFEIPVPPRLGKRILDVDRLSCKMDGRILFKDVSLIMQKGMRLGIVGRNGCGKTTLLRSLMGEEEKARGKVVLGESTEFLYIDQTHSEIDPDQSILDFVSDGGNYIEVNGRRVYIPAYLERLLFDMDTVYSPMGNLSGGERNRVELAKKLLKGGNVLVLDEPTNDLDLPTLRVLEEAVEAFDGCAIIVSHDRYFINRLCTHLIVFEEDDDLYFSAGNYDDYHAYHDQKIAEQKMSEKPQPSPAGNTPTVAPPVSNASPQRLTYKEKQELAEMEESILDAEGRVGELEARVSEPEFYQSDHKAVQEVLQHLERAREKVTTLYQRWNDLESRKAIKN